MNASWGKMTPKDIQMAIAAPEGEAVKIIRKYDPCWGYKGKKVEFEVTIVRREIQEYEYKEKIAASTIEEAKEIAKKINDSVDTRFFKYIRKDIEQYVEEVQKIS